MVKLDPCFTFKYEHDNQEMTLWWTCLDKATKDQSDRWRGQVQRKEFAKEWQFLYNESKTEMKWVVDEEGGVDLKYVF